jgi:hypothetical protein
MHQVETTSLEDYAPFQKNNLRYLHQVETFSLEDYVILRTTPGTCTKSKLFPFEDYVILRTTQGTCTKSKLFRSRTMGSTFFLISAPGRRLSRNGVVLNRYVSASSGRMLMRRSCLLVWTDEVTVVFYDYVNEDFYDVNEDLF